MVFVPSNRVSSEELVLSRFSETSLQQETLRSASQAQMEGLISGFVEQSTDWRSLAALMAGGVAYRLGRAGAFAVLPGSVSPLSHGIAPLVGLASEVTAFQGVTDALSPSPLAGEGRGEGGYWSRWTTSFVQFGLLKVGGAAVVQQNVFVRHLLQDTSMVAGHQLTTRLGWTSAPEGNLAEQFLHAEVTNLQLIVGMGLVHGAAPGFSMLERGLELSALRQEGEGNSTLPLSHFEFRETVLEGISERVSSICPEASSSLFEGPQLIFAGAGGNVGGKIAGFLARAVRGGNFARMAEGLKNLFGNNPSQETKAQTISQAPERVVAPPLNGEVLGQLLQSEGFADFTFYYDPQSGRVEARPFENSRVLPVRRSREGEVRVEVVDSERTPLIRNIEQQLSADSLRDAVAQIVRGRTINFQAFEEQYRYFGDLNERHALCLTVLRRTANRLFDPTNLPPLHTLSTMVREVLSRRGSWNEGCQMLSRFRNAILDRFEDPNFPENVLLRQMSQFLDQSLADYDRQLEPIIKRLRQVRESAEQEGEAGDEDRRWAFAIAASAGNREALLHFREILNFPQGWSEDLIELGEVLAFFDYGMDYELIPRFRQLLAHPDPRVIDRAAGVLGALRDFESIPVLRTLLNYPKAIDALAELQDYDSIPAIRNQLRHSDWMVKRKAARALGILGDFESRDVLREMLNIKDDYSVVDAAIDSLVRLKDFGSSPAIQQLLKNGVSYRASVALGALQHLESVPVLRQELKSRSLYHVGSATRALHQMGNNEALPFLRKWMSKGHAADRVDAAGLLYEMGNMEGVPILRKLLRSRDLYAVRDAAEELARMGIRDGIPHLNRLMREDIPLDVRPASNISIWAARNILEFLEPTPENPH